MDKEDDMVAFLRSAVVFLVIVLGMPATFFAQPQTEKSNTCCPDIQEAESKYLAANQYNEFVAFLNDFKDKDKLNAPCLDYYKARARFLQLKYLEENQAWDDYFANGNAYRDELVENAQKVIAQTEGVPVCLRPKSRLLLWQFHHGQQDAFAQPALEDLVAEVSRYAKQSSDLGLIKEIADELLSNEEKSKAREIYKLYVEGLVAQKMTASQLKEVAAGFYKQGNLELAESVYDIYIEEISKTSVPEKLIPELFEIADLFVYGRHGEGLVSGSLSLKTAGFYDMAYAEKIYAGIEALGQKDAFNQDTIYLRAFNLEKMHAYKEAQKFYQQLTQTYPDTKYFDEAIYKIAMINAYALADINEARKYFDILGAKTVLSAHTVSSLYQLGLLAQWQGDLVKASSYYEQLLKNAQDKYVAVVALTQERIKEIQENKPLSYNLKTFLDLSLNNEQALIEMNKTELKSSSYILQKNQNNTVSSLVSMPQSGCNQVELQYLWSGDLGGANPAAGESNFSGAYSDSGTKDVNIVIISPAGTVDRSFTMLDVY
ncbi:MAG TPA: tetratricopeptide repeat protein [Candidatus Omnitrophota bacterium]|nr:tetratricopeptide repeat protein [Candidatus Omnitrophota bacterium]